MTTSEKHQAVRDFVLEHEIFRLDMVKAIRFINYAKSIGIELYVSDDRLRMKEVPEEREGKRIMDFVNGFKK